MAAWPSIGISPSQSQDSACGASAAIISPSNSYASAASSSTSRLRRSPQFRKSPKRNGGPKKKQKESTIIAILRVVILASFLVFVLVCILQSQHLVIHEDAIGGATIRTADQSGFRHPLTDKLEWKVKGSLSREKRDTASSSLQFDGPTFESKLRAWREETHRLDQQETLHRLTQQHEDQFLKHSLASPTSRLLQVDNTTKPPQPRLHIPFWDQQTLYRHRRSWHLMTVILADDCLHNYRKEKRITQYPTLVTLKEALQTQHADVIVYLAQTPNSILFPKASELNRIHQQSCQATLQAMLHTHYASQLESGQLQLIHGTINPLHPRIAYQYHHHLPAALKQLEAMKLPANQYQPAKERLQHKMQLQQLQLEIDYSLGLDFAYISELVYQHGDLLLFLRAGTTTTQTTVDYAQTIVDEYERFQQRLDKDLLVHRFCYMSFLQQDEWYQLPVGNQTHRDLPPRYQQSLGAVPTGIVLERHTLYRLSMVLRSLLPYRKSTTTELLMLYCDELLWEAQVLQPVSEFVLAQNATVQASDFPPALFVVEERHSVNASSTNPPQAALPPLPQEELPPVSPYVVQQELAQLQHHYNNDNQQPSIPSWVTVDHRQLGPQRNTYPSDVLELPDNNNNHKTVERKLVTFVVPTSTRPNGIKNQYVTYSLNQLFPLIRRDFKNKATGQLEASVLLVICGNTQDELDDHEEGLYYYYGPELKEGILEIVATNLATYPSLHNIPNNYNDPENRLRWRSKQNLDISSSFFAAKGKSDYVMLLEDDTGYRDKFTPTLRALIESDQRQEANLVPQPAVTGVGPFGDDYRQHIFAQVHFGFGYSGVLIHDDDALVYAVLHYVLMDEKPCDLLYLANYLQGQVLDQKWRWQLKKVLLTHLGSVSSLKGKIQPVWGLKG